MSNLSYVESQVSSVLGFAGGTQSLEGLMEVRECSEHIRLVFPGLHLEKCITEEATIARIGDICDYWMKGCQCHVAHGFVYRCMRCDLCTYPGKCQGFMHTCLRQYA